MYLKFPYKLVPTFEWTVPQTEKNELPMCTHNSINDCVVQFTSNCVISFVMWLTPLTDFTMEVAVTQINKFITEVAKNFFLRGSSLKDI